MAQLPKAPALGQASLGAGVGENLPGAGVRSVRRRRPGILLPEARSTLQRANRQPAICSGGDLSCLFWFLILLWRVERGVAGRQGLNSQCQGGWA